MASGGHVMQAQRNGVEHALRSLTNPELKHICKEHGQLVSGTKAVLLKRCIDVLDDIVRKGHPEAFDRFQYRVAHRGVSPPANWLPPSRTGEAHATAAYQPAYSKSMARGGAVQHKAIGSAKFKSSPFYEIDGTVLNTRELPAGPEQPQTRHTDKCQLKLGDDVANRLKHDSSLRLMIYCGEARLMSPYSPVDVAFPNQIEVRVNNEVLKHNFKGLKNKPGSTKPADITALVRKMGAYTNQLEITYALTTKRYAFVVHIVRYVGAQTLTERIRRGNVISKQAVLVEMNKANADPDIAATSTVMSLKDPVSTMRITLPIRSTVCTHNQCFDGSMFMQLQEQAPTWTCPVCSKHVVFESLAIDKYVEEILSSTSKSTEKVTVEPDGVWRIVKVEEDEDKPNAGKGQPRASYDDDFDDDDDLVEVTEPQAPKPQINGFASSLPTRVNASPFAAVSPSFQTPPLSSREASIAQSGTSLPSGQRPANKRTSSAVIDLTLSDDDEPPRPAKRKATGGNQQGNSFIRNTYHSPTSLPRYDTYHPTNGHTDSYRPGSSTSAGGGHHHRPSQGSAYSPQRTSFPPPSPSHFQQPSAPTSNGWSQYSTLHNSDGSSGFTPFSIRERGRGDRSQAALQSPHSVGAAPQQQPQQQQQQQQYSSGGTGSAGAGMRLPPMQIRPPDDPYAGGWRSSDYRYSNSPA